VTPRMIPASLPAAVRGEPKRSAEVKVFDALSGASILKGFTVWYSPRWLSGYRGILRDGEADFILAHPEWGFLVVEVKGGRVKRDVITGAWSSRDRYGDDQGIENPIEQAIKSKKVLLNYLKKYWQGGAAPWVRNRHGVVLPHGSRPKAPMDLGAAMPLEIFAFHEDLEKLGAKLIQMLTWQPEGVSERIEPLGREGMRLIEQFCGRDVSFDLSLKAQLDAAEDAIFQLTSEQNRVLDLLKLFRRAHFKGGAGTGKTVLAVEKARRLDAEGASVLLLCFNRPLRTQLKRELADTRVEAMTFHELCGEVCRQAGIPAEARAHGVLEKRFLSDVLPGLFEDALLGGAGGRYDAVLVDEAQDFRPQWLEACRLLLGKDGGTFFVFSDENQNIYAGLHLDERFGEVIPLNTNLRNSLQIFEASSRFYRGEALACRGPVGPEVRWIEAPADRTRRTVERLLNSLVLGEGVPRGDIAVLTGCSIEKSSFARGSAIGEHATCDAEEAVPGCVTLDSVYRFKGLEKPVVIVADMDGCAAEPEVPYVALSRAKSLLAVIGTASTLSHLQRP